MDEVASSTWLREAVSTMVMSRPSIWWVIFFRNMGPLGSRPRCSVLVYAYLCKYATRIRAQKGFLFVQHPNIGNFNSSEVKGVTALYFQTSTKIEKILWLPDCRSTPPQLQWGEVLSTSLLLFQQWPGAFNKWGSFKCLPSFQANSYVRSQTTNNQHSSSKNPRLTDSRQKRAQKKYRSGGDHCRHVPFLKERSSGSNGLPKQERRGRTHCTCQGSSTSGPTARKPI